MNSCLVSVVLLFLCFGRKVLYVLSANPGQAFLNILLLKGSLRRARKGYCVDASKNDALFTWAENVILYYNFARIGNAVDGFKIKINYRIGGKNDKIMNRLLDDFINTLSTLFGSFTYETEIKTIKKT